MAYPTMARRWLVLAGLLIAMALLLPHQAFADDNQLKASTLNNSQTSSLSAQSTLSAQMDLSLFGVDVSEHQGWIDWGATSKVVDFAILRCGYGNNDSWQDDKQWQNNVSGCRNHGVPFGVYIYSYATDVGMAQSEAMHVVRCLNEAGLNSSHIALPIYLDMEDPSTAGLSEWDYLVIFNTFRSTMNANGYGMVGIYASASWWEYKLTSISLAPEYRWVAHWGVGEPGAGAYNNTRNTGCGLWQYSSDGVVSGIGNRVDVNRGSRDLAHFSSSSDKFNLYRVYNPNSGEHFYTLDPGERTHLESLGWVYESITMRTPKSGGVPVYRVYNPNAGDHHYTLDAGERDWLASLGWVAEGTAWNAVTSGTPIYRLYNPNAIAGAHHFTESASERDWLITMGWSYEGIAMYSAA